MAEKQQPQRLQETDPMTDPTDLTIKGPFYPPRGRGSVVADIDESERASASLLRSKMRHPSYLPAKERMAMWDQYHKLITDE
jgi:hypothetical protein